MENPDKATVQETKREKDWTKGSITRNLLSLAWPIVISQCLDMTGPIFDLIWVGKLNPASVAGVGIAGMIVILANSAMLGLTVGVRALVARFIGAGDKEGANHIIGQAFVIVVGFYIILALTGIFLAEPIMELFGVEADVVVKGAIYLRIMLASAIAVAIWMTSAGAMQASGDTVTPMRIAIVFRLVHVVLCPFLVFGWWLFPEMGVSGAATANAAAQAVGMALGLWVLSSGRTRLRLTMRNFRFDPEMIWRMVRISLPNLFMHIQHHLCSLTLIWIITPFGTLPVAAHTIWQRADALLIVLVMAVGMGAGVLGAQNLGAQQPERAVKTGWMAARLSVVIMIVMLAVVLIWAEQIISIFSPDAELIKIGAVFLRISTASYLTLALNNVFLTFLIGVGDTTMALVLEMLQTWGVQLPLAFILSRYTPLGILGVRWAIVAAIVVAGIIFTLYFRWGKWKYKTV